MRKPPWHRPHHARHEYMPARGTSNATADRSESLREGTVVPDDFASRRGANERQNQSAGGSFAHGAAFRRPVPGSEREIKQTGCLRDGSGRESPHYKTHTATVVFASNCIFEFEAKTPVRRSFTERFTLVRCSERRVTRRQVLLSSMARRSPQRLPYRVAVFRGSGAPAPGSANLSSPSAI